MRYKKTIYIFLLSLVFLNLGLIYATSINNNNKDTYFRIHVIANSDSIEDQLLKYKIAKSVNEYIDTLTKSSTSKEESKQIIENNIQNILKLCNNVITSENYSYSLKAQIGKIEYSTKYKDGLQMPAGVYDSLKIVIGNGNGQNWWSLIYPTTFTDVETQQLVDEDVNYSFGIIELLKNMFVI